ncbi:MAG: PEP-utilizing enzyme [bacterium]|nr:PEP-utilizing enzyme [bacterium]
MNIIRKYNLDKYTWTYKGFHAVLHPFIPVIESGPEMEKVFKDSNKLNFLIVKDHYVHWYWCDADLTRIRTKFFKRLNKNPNYLRSLQNKWQQSLKKFEVIIKKTHNTELKKLSNEKLAETYDIFYKHFLNEFSYFMTLGDSISMHADRYIVPEFQKLLGKDFNQVFPQIVTTRHTSFLDQEFKDRQKLLTIYKKTKKIPQKLLDKHSAKYHFITNNYARVKYLTASDFKKLIIQDAKGKKPPTLSVKKLSKDKLLKKYKITKKQSTMLYVLDQFFGIQDTRKKYAMISTYYQFRFLREAARRSKIPFDLLRFSSFREFRDILSRTISRTELQKRSKLCMCIQNNNVYDIYTGQEVMKVFKYFSNLDKNNKELKGIVASEGKTEGIVKKILKAHDMVNMDDGDIIIASMTRPEMLPAMKRSSAIITDEGGLTCHAAIVARELGIPCIIGTKNATKLFKDGDKVMVDAYKGIIKKV